MAILYVLSNNNDVGSTVVGIFDNEVDLLAKIIMMKDSKDYHVAINEYCTELSYYTKLFVSSTLANSLKCCEVPFEVTQTYINNLYEKNKKILNSALKCISDDIRETIFEFLFGVDKDKGYCVCDKINCCGCDRRMTRQSNN